MDCIFCKIIAGEIPSGKIYEDDKIFAFHDINPAAPVHFLVVPKAHIDSLNNMHEQNNADYICHALRKIPELAAAQNIAGDGYRVINNIGKNGQQSVPHLHFHVIGGRKLKWEF